MDVNIRVRNVFYVNIGQIISLVPASLEDSGND